MRELKSHEKIILAQALAKVGLEVIEKFISNRRQLGGSSQNEMQALNEAAQTLERAANWLYEYTGGHLE